MATYLYQTIPTDGSEPRQFEYVQSMKEAALTKDPQTGEPVRRVITGGLPFAVNGLKPIDPHDSKAFLKKTNVPGTVGEMWDRSKELSERRAAKEGADPVKQAYYKDYSKKHKGRKHISEKKEGHDAAIKELNTKLKKFDVKIGLA